MSVLEHSDGDRCSNQPSDNGPRLVPWSVVLINPYGSDGGGLKW